MLPILHQSLWRDEAFSILLAEKSPFEIIRLAITDVSPGPLHYLILHYYMLVFGNSEIVARSLSLIFHILTVLIIFFIIRKVIKSTLTQILITLSVLFNPFLLQYAFEARAYSLLVFLTILALYMVSVKKDFLASIVLTLGILTHNFGVLNFIAFAAWWAYISRGKLKIKESLQFLGFPIIIVLIWGGVIYNQWTKIAEGFWIKQATSSIFLHSFEVYMKGDLTYPTQPMLYVFSLILAFFAFSYWVWKEKDQENQIPLLFFSIALVPTLITYFVSALFIPIYHERYLITTAPMLILIIAYSLYKLYYMKPNLHNVIIGFIAVYLILLLQSSEQIIATTTKPAINWSISQILSRAREGDVIIPQDNINFLETKYYVQRSGKNIEVLAYTPDGKIPFYIGAVLFEPYEIVTEIPKYNRVWQIKPDGGYELLNQ